MPQKLREQAFCSQIRKIVKSQYFSYIRLDHYANGREDKARQGDVVGGLKWGNNKSTNTETGVSQPFLHQILLRIHFVVRRLQALAAVTALTERALPGNTPYQNWLKLATKHTKIYSDAYTVIVSGYTG